MAKISDFRKARWYLIERTLASGDHPRAAVIIDALRDLENGPVSDEVRYYLADLLEGKKRRSRGRPKASDYEKFEAHNERIYWSDRVIRWKRVLEKRYKIPDAYHAALEKVSQESGIPEDTLDKYRYPRRKRS